MSCCGRRRQAYKAWLVPRSIRLRFVGGGTFEARGATTGRTYVASEAEREVEVDPRDAKEILQSGRFEIMH